MVVAEEEMLNNERRLLKKIVKSWLTNKIASVSMENNSPYKENL